MYNEDSYDETVNPAFDLYREFRAEDERKFREALGENESDNFDDQASEAGADSWKRKCWKKLGWQSDRRRN